MCSIYRNPSWKIPESCSSVCDLQGGGHGGNGEDLVQGGAKLLKSCRRFILELKAGGVLWIFCVLGAIKIPGQTEIGASPPRFADGGMAAVIVSLN